MQDEHDEHEIDSLEIRRDLVAAGVIAILVFALLAPFDLAELWYESTREEEGWELDELPLLLVSFAVALSVLAYRSLLAATREARRRRAVERSLDEARQRERMLLETAVDGGWEWHASDPDAISVSQSAYMDSDRPRHRLEIGEQLPFAAGLLEPDVYAQFRDLTEGRTARFESEIDARLRPDGPMRRVAIVGRSIDASSEGERRVVGTWVDVSVRVELERRLREHQRAAALGAFSRGVAHDLGNVLIALETYAQHLSGSTERDATGVAGIHRSIERARGLVRTLMEFGGLPADPQWVDLNAIVQESVTELRTTLREGIEIELRLGKSIPAIQSGSIAIERVVINLVQNACEALPDDGRIVVSTESIEANGFGDRVRLAVEDNGRGFDGDVMTRALEPYFSTKGEGRVGLGLNIVDTTIRQLGGDVRIETVDGGGARIVLEFPANVAGLVTP